MWYDISSSNAEEKIVWACVLRRSIFDYVLYKGNIANRILYQKAQSFIFGEKNGEDSLSFEEVCGLFGWDPDYIRKLIRKLNRDDIKKLDTNKFLDLFDDSESFTFAPEFWNLLEAPLPFMPYWKYSKEVRDQLVVKRIQRQSLRITPAPMVAWS